MFPFFPDFPPFIPHFPTFFPFLCILLHLFLWENQTWALFLKGIHQPVPLLSCLRMPSTLARAVTAPMSYHSHLHGSSDTEAAPGHEPSSSSLKTKPIHPGRGCQDIATSSHKTALGPPHCYRLPRGCILQSLQSSGITLINIFWGKKEGLFRNPACSSDNGKVWLSARTRGFYLLLRLGQCGRCSRMKGLIWRAVGKMWDVNNPRSRGGRGSSCFLRWVLFT